MTDEVLSGPVRRVRDAEYRALATFRHALRGFLAFSEAAARDNGLTPQHHQALLAIKGHSHAPLAIGELAEQLLIRHHSAVELVDRLAKADLVARSESPEDRRRVLLRLTHKAEALLEDLSAIHLAELKRIRPLLADLLRLLDASKS